MWIHSSVLSLQFLDVLSAMIYRYKGLKKKASPFHTKKSSNYTLLPVLAIYNCKYPRGWAHSSEVVNWYMCESVNAFCNFFSDIEWEMEIQVFLPVHIILQFQINSLLYTKHIFSMRAIWRDFSCQLCQFNFLKILTESPLLLVFYLLSSPQWIQINVVQLEPTTMHSGMIYYLLFIIY